MKPVYQTKFGSKDGNCMVAALASIFEIEIDDIPKMNPAEQEEKGWHTPWSKILNDWLKEKYGLAYYEIPYSEFKKIEMYWNVAAIGYHILFGTSPRHANTNHATVGLNGELVHDPIGKDGPGIPDDKKKGVGIFLKIVQ